MTEIDAISTTVEKTQHIIAEIERELGWEGRADQAYSALRVVLHTLRDRLPVNEAVNFGAQLPELLRGVYYEGWNPSQVPVKMNREQFVEHVRTRFVYSMEADIQLMIMVVLETLSLHISYGEVEKVKNSLPKDIAELLPKAA